MNISTDTLLRLACYLPSEERAKWNRKIKKASTPEEKKMLYQELRNRSVKSYQTK